MINQRMKLKKRVKVILIIALIVILLAVASIFAYKAFSKPTIKEAKVLKEIKEYGYVLKDNKSKKYQALFKDLVKIGYADGISRCLSNNITVKVNGNICDQVGNICMDLMMIDVTNLKDVKINDEVTIWDYNNDLKQIAQKSNKIVYEVISNIGNRVERIIE